jgi:nucleotide sugar dehydrogenase
MKTIICIGCGTVGYATCLSLSSLGHSIIGIDKCLNARNRMIKYGFLCYSLEEILFEDKLNDILIDAMLIALPTPYCPLIKTLSDEYLMSSIPLISFFLKKKLDEKSLLIIIHSTVSVGTSRSFLNALKNENIDKIRDYYLIYHPEFLRAKTSEYDALNPIKQIFAYVDEKSQIDSTIYLNILQEIFSPDGFSRPSITMIESVEEAEYLKLVHNFSNALRISFSNCCAQLASLLSLKLDKQIDASRVLSIVSETAESFYNNKYGIIPGYPYSGHCLPKDVLCFTNITEEQPYQQFIQSVHLINEKEKYHQLVKDSSNEHIEQ